MKYHYTIPGFKEWFYSLKEAREFLKDELRKDTNPSLKVWRGSKNMNIVRENWDSGKRVEFDWRG